MAWYVQMAQRLFELFMSCKLESFAAVSTRLFFLKSENVKKLALPEVVDCLTRKRPNPRYNARTTT